MTNTLLLVGGVVVLGVLAFVAWPYLSTKLTGTPQMPPFIESPQQQQQQPSFPITPSLAKTMGDTFPGFLKTYETNPEFRKTAESLGQNPYSMYATGRINYF